MVKQLIKYGLAILLLVSLIFVCGCISGKETNSTANVSSTINNPYDNINISANNYIETNGLTAAQKADAINIIINDSIVKELITRPNTSYSINDVSLVDADSYPWDMKDRNVSACMALVPMTLTISTVNGSYDITAWNSVNGLVNLSNNRCMELIVTDFRGDPEYGYVVVPPESSWHILLTSWTPSYEINTTFEPIEAKIYPLVLDRANFTNYKNGMTYQVKENMDHFGEKHYYDGSMPISQNDTIFINTQDNGAVLVLKSVDGIKESKINLKF